MLVDYVSPYLDLCSVSLDIILRVFFSHIISFYVVLDITLNITLN